jgi:hypothetical protein
MELDMISRKILVIAAIMYSVSVPMLANAKQPHPVQPEPAPGVDFCDCSAFTPVPDSDMYESYCSVQWTTTGNYWPAYGASIEYEAEWMEDDSEMSVGSETEIEEYSCVFGADDVCNANDVHVVIDGHPEEAEVEFQAKVKGFDNKGEGSRDFVKVTGDCSID